MEESPVLVIPYACPRESLDIVDVKLIAQRRIAEYSVTAEHEIHLENRANARFLLDKRVNSTLNIDLKKGIDTIVRQELEDEACLNVLLKWACLQEGDNVKEICKNAEFVGWQGTFRRIASSFVSRDAMGIVAVKVDGVIFLSETEQKFGEHDSRWETDEPFYEGYAPFKFKRVMTTRAEGKIDHNEPIDNRPSFQVCVRSELVNTITDESISLFVGSSVEALTEQGEAVEFRIVHKEADPWTAKKGSGAVFRNLNSLLRCDLSDLKWIVFGARTTDFILTKTMTRGRDEFEDLVGDWHRKAYIRLFDILKGIRRYLDEVDVDSCVVEFPVDTENGKVIRITRASEEESRRVLTEEFKCRFNIE